MPIKKIKKWFASQNLPRKNKRKPLDLELGHGIGWIFESFKISGAPPLVFSATYKLIIKLLKFLNFFGPFSARHAMHPSTFRPLTHSTRPGSRLCRRLAHICDIDFVYILPRAAQALSTNHTRNTIWHRIIRVYMVFSTRYPWRHPASRAFSHGTYVSCPLTKE